jgi:hypothetical protein
MKCFRFTVDFVVELAQEWPAIDRMPPEVKEIMLSRLREAEAMFNGEVAIAPGACVRLAQFDSCSPPNCFDVNKTYSDGAERVEVLELIGSTGK